MISNHDISDEINITFDECEANLVENNNISNSQFQPNQTVRNNNFNADEYLKKMKLSNKKDEMEFSKEKEYLKQSKENFNKSSLK